MATSPTFARRSGGSRGRSAATRSSTCCPRTAAAWTASWSARRARSAVVLEATVELVPDEPRRLVVLGYPSMADAADAVPTLLAEGERLVACEGLDARIVDLVRGSGWRGAAAAAGSGLALRRGRRGTARCPRPGSSSGARSTIPPRPRRSGGSARTAPGSRPAAWTDRRTRAGRTPPYLPSGSAPGSASSTSCSPSTACTASPTATSATAACTSGSTSSSTTAGGAGSASSWSRAPTRCAAHGGSLSGEHGDGRARSELLPLMYDEESLRLFAAVKAVCDPDNLLNPGVLVDPAPLDADLRPGRPRAVGHHRAPAGPRRRLARRRGPSLHRCRQVRRHRDDRRDVSVPPGDPRREGLDPWPGPGAAGGTRRRARARPRRPGRHRGARPLPVLQGLRERLPDRRGHGDVQGGGAAPAVRRPPTSALPLHAGPAAPLGGAGRADGRHREPAGRWPARPAGEGRGWRGPAPLAADVCAGVPAPLGPEGSCA